jgi:DNA invertase Pin-like site-specific DNA recombinase
MTRHHGKFVSYLRVSTKRQGESGLGLEAQRKAVNWQLVKELVEVESGKHDHNRPALHKALEACKVYGATLVIAKLDRLSRDAHFLLGLQKAGVKFVAADMPEANEMVVGIMALVAQAERRMISERTKAALQAAKARGVRAICRSNVLPRGRSPGATASQRSCSTPQTAVASSSCFGT